MEDFKEYHQLFDGWTKRITADEGQQVKQRKYEIQKTFPELRADYIKQSAWHRMLKSLSGTSVDQWPELLRSLENGPDLETEAKAKINKVDYELEELQEQMDDLISEAQINHDKMKTKLKELDAKLEEMDIKRARLDDLEARHSKALQEMERRKVPKDNYHEILQTQRDKLGKIGPCRAEVESLSSRLREEIASVQEECHTREDLIGQMKRVAEAKRQERMERDGTHNKQKEWIARILALMTNLTCVSFLKSTRESITFQIRSPVRPTFTAELTAKFKDNGRYMALTGAEIDVSDMDISEVVLSAVGSDDVVYLVQGVLGVMSSHAPLLEEIEELRSLYAVDYLHEEGILRLMMGSKGQIICTLKIEQGYPQTGSVKLTGLDGAMQTSQVITDLKPGVENPRLKDWVEYLKAETETM